MSAYRGKSNTFYSSRIFCVENENYFRPVELLIDFCVNRAASFALFFARKGDDWGRMFSYNDWIPKLFPKISEFDILREHSLRYYNCIKVFTDAL